MEGARKIARYPVEETAAKHERIVKKASRLFRELGFENANVADVMKAAGLTHGAFYAHFDSKEKLSELATVSVQSTCLCSCVIVQVVCPDFTSPVTALISH